MKLRLGMMRAFGFCDSFAIIVFLTVITIDLTFLETVINPRKKIQNFGQPLIQSKQHF